MTYLFIFNLIFLSLVQLFSRGLGLLRDLFVIAIVDGDQEQSSLFLFSEKIPKVLYGVFFDGVCLQLAFPVLSRYKNKIRNKDDNELESNLFSVFFVMFLFASLVALVGANILVAIFAPTWFSGWLHNLELSSLYTGSVSMVRMMLPGFFFMCMASFLGLSLNIRNSYTTTAMLPAIMNCSFIVGSLLYKPSQPLTFLALIFNVGSLVNFVMQLFYAWRLGVDFRITNISFGRKIIKRICRDAPLVILTSVVMQLASLMPTVFATFYGPKYVGQVSHAFRVTELLLSATRAGILTLLPTILGSRYRELEQENAGVIETTRQRRVDYGADGFRSWLGWGASFLAQATIPVSMWGIWRARILLKEIYAKLSMSSEDLDSLHHMLCILLVYYIVHSICRVLSVAVFAIMDVGCLMRATILALCVQTILSSVSLWSAPYTLTLAALCAALSELYYLASFLYRRGLLFDTAAFFRCCAWSILVSGLSMLVASHVLGVIILYLPVPSVRGKLAAEFFLTISIYAGTLLFWRRSVSSSIVSSISLACANR